MSTERWMTTIWSDSVLEVLRRRRPQSSRRGTSWEAREIVLCSFALKHLMDWSYDERVVTGSLIYRRFCRIDAGKVPDAKTMVRLNQLRAKLIQTDHGLGVGHLAGIDAAEPSVDQATGDHSLVVAPVHQMLERKRAQHDLPGFPRRPPATTLRPTPSQNLQNAIRPDRRHPALGRHLSDHELLHLRDHQLEEHHLRDRQP